MAAPNKKRMKDSEILATVEALEKECVGWSDSKLSIERSRVMKYYNGELPAQQHKGSSPYRSSDVYDSVEAIKTQVVETFSTGDEIISFPPQHEQDVEAARDATAYTAYVVFRQNSFETFAHDVVHDGLTSRIGVVKVYWDEHYEYEDYEFEGLSYEDVMGLAAQEDNDELEGEADETGIFAGTFRKRIDKSQVRIDCLPMEEVAVSAGATRDIERADVVSHKTLKDRAKLKEMWPDRAKDIDDLPCDASELTTTEEAVERNAAVDGVIVSGETRDPELNKITLWESYARMDLKDGKGVCRYKVCHAGTLLLDVQEVERLPFKVFVPLPTPHTLWGNNFAAKIISTQNARTVLTRAVLDHAQITTNPRYTVLKGGLLNPKEMLDNRLGGLVNINRQDAVKALEQAPLNPFVFQLLEMLKSNKEESTGVSSLSQGLNKDAISSQNSQGLVNDLVNLSQQRQKMIARNFSKFLVDVFLEVYRLVLENEKEAKVVEIVDGRWEKFDPTKWVERTACRVSVNLGYGERDRKAAKYASAYAQLAQDPILGPVFGLEQRHAMAVDTMKLMGFDAPAKYLGDPAKAKPPGPDPLKMRELDIKEKTAEAALITAKATAQSKQTDSAVKMLQAQLKQVMDKVGIQLDMRESDRLDIEMANRVDVSQREMKLAEAAPAEATNTIISTNG